jgi:predicted RNase H-like nuclease (RuvC/YqgF family)
MTGGAGKQTYSFLQEGTEEDSTASSGIKAVRMVKRLAKRVRSHALAQLASRLDATVRSGETSGDDPFAKVKDLISEMIGRLSDEADAEAQHKLWCDKAMGETTRKKKEKESSIEKLTTQIDQLTAGSAKLSEEVATLQKELAELAEASSLIKKIRQEENDLFKKSKPEMEDGVKGVKLAVNALRDYYSGGDKGQSGAGRSIIGLLEVVESDFAKGLSEIIAEEEAAVKSYEKEMKENEIARTTKEQDVKYKSKEMKAWTKQGTELSSDRDSLQAELDAVNEYFARLKEQCIAKAEPYEERKKRRDREIQGLQEALKTLEGPGGEGGITVAGDDRWWPREYHHF